MGDKNMLFSSDNGTWEWQPVLVMKMDKTLNKQINLPTYRKITNRSRQKSTTLINNAKFKNI